MCALPRHIKAKVVHLVDATVDSLFDYYTEFSNLLWHNYREAHILGKRAFKRADLIIASSDWCKRNAINQYGISPDKITVVEFGANIDAKDIPHQVKHYSAGEPLNIYWSGVNWERKGGEVALECCRELTNLGINVHFHITGMKTLPEEIENLPWVVNHGFLNKNNPSEYQKLIDIISKQHIFLFPSRAECSSIALCEANAFSLPCFAYDTGGTANYITDTVNGRMLPLTASGSDFANAILGTLPNYESMSAAARKKYETSLNWETWSSHVARSINFIVIPKQVL
jgi:glycosyltransferase involved in cell wall biosynthesis